MEHREMQKGKEMFTVVSCKRVERLHVTFLSYYIVIMGEAGASHKRNLDSSYAVWDTTQQNVVLYCMFEIYFY